MRDQASADFDNPVIYKDVVIVGNGPGGLSASSLLAGLRPVYNGLGHPDPMLSARLTSSLEKGDSLLDTEKIRFLSQGMEELGRCSRVGALFDSLMRPGIHSTRGRDSPLTWHRREPPLDHVVLGNGPPGGIWQRLDPELLTLSLSSWMELPGLRVAQGEVKRRATAREVAHYYQRYVAEKGLSKFQQDCQVTSIKNIGKGPEARWRWEVEAIDKNGNHITYRSRFCILACGVCVPKRLNVAGEDGPNVVHDLATLEARLNAFQGQRCRVLVVGCGLSGADAVLLARFKGASVEHSFRTEDGSLARLTPETFYPEYHKVREMMRGRGGYPGYRAHPGTAVSALTDSAARLRRVRAGADMAAEEDKMAAEVDFDLAAVLIGTAADLSFLKDFRAGLDLSEAGSDVEISGKSNPVAVDWRTYEVRRARGLGLYAIGALAGDLYVRYIPGGAVAACADILRQTAGARPQPA